MFGSTPKTPFGTGGFGNTSSSLFGAKTQATSAFGTPSFGNTSSAFGGGTSTSGLFGSSNAGSSLFSQPSTQQSTGFSFGQQKTGGLFGTSTQSSNFFQTPQTTSTFGGFGTNTAAGTTSTGLFGSSFGTSTSNPIGGGGGLFAGSSAFGSAAPNGTTVKFNPVTSTESVNKNGTSINVQTKYQCITSMKEYESKSIEELRFEDYTAGRKTGSNASLFGSSTNKQQPSLFGSSATTGFGQNKTATFGGFGPTATTSSSLFGQSNPSGGGLFGSKPIGTGSIFGATTTTTNSGFGLGTSGGLFGQTSTTGPRFGSTGTATGGLFGASTGFGAAQKTSTTGGLFGTSTSTFGQPQSGGLFGATSKPFTFGTTSSGTSTFGGNTFGTTGATGLFGSTATSKPAFSFNPSGTSGFGSTLGSFGTSTSLGSGGLFGSSTGTTTGGGLFGGQTSTGFGTGLGGTSGFGSTLGGTTAIGGLGGLGAATGLTGNQNLAGLTGVNQASFAAFQQQQVLQQQLKALANSPFGDSPLFRNLTASRKNDSNVTVPVPSSKSATASSHYKVFSKPAIKVRMKSSPFLASTKTSLFDGIGDDYCEEDANLTPRRSVKKLAIKGKSKGYLNGTVESSPLRLRSTTDVDYDDLVSRIPAMPRLPADSQSEKVPTENTVTSPILNIVKEKADENKETSVNEADSTVDSSDAEEHSDSDEETENPCGIVLKRPEYYTIPSTKELNKMDLSDGKCLVENFIVGREDYGEVKFLGTTDVKDLNLDKIVFFRRREAEVYPDDYTNKPEVGKELNKKSEISLHKVWPNDKTSHTPIKSPERLKKSGFIERLEEKTSALGAMFLDYKPDQGTWVFQVEHFTRYGLNEQLYEEDSKQIILKKLKMAAAQKAEAIRQEMETEKQNKMLIDEESQKEKLKQKQSAILTRPIVEGELMDEETTMAGADSDAENDKEDAFSTSIQTAKISGVDPQRLQGMKALLFGDDDDAGDFLSPREKSLLANKSIISAGVREAQLIERFDQTNGRVDKSNSTISLFSERLPRADSPMTVTRRTKLLKTSHLDEEEGKFVDFADSNRLLFSSTTRFSHKEAQAQIITAKRKAFLVPRRLSCLQSKEAHISDAGLSNGRRSRVGWGPKLHLFHAGGPLGSEIDGLKSATKEQAVLLGFDGNASRALPSSPFTVTVEKICIGDEKDDHSYLVECLQNVLKHSKVTAENEEPPFVETVEGVNALHAFAELTEKYLNNKDAMDYANIQYQHAVVWDLVKALWGRLENTDHVKLSSYQSQVHRRHAVSKWLSKIVEKEIKKEIDSLKTKDSGHLDAIFSLLSARKIREACELACQNREYRLALLLSQASGDLQMKHLLRKQLDEWKTSLADKFMNASRLKIYQLLSGLMVWMSAHGDLNLCENLDWKRSFALHLWFFCSTTSSISKGLEEYRNAFKGTDTYSPYAAPPKPCYATDRCAMVDNEDLEAQRQPKDICYHILKLYSKRSHRLERVLCPNTHTEDPLDYQLCWQLQQVLESLGYTHLSESYCGLIQTSFASQLETYGLWEWAVFVLLHIKENKRRETAVREVLSRHCCIQEDFNKLTEKELLLIKSLKVPATWIYDAKAQHARYSGKTQDETFYLLKAERWSDAHEVLVKYLAADAIIDGDYRFLKEVLLELTLPERMCTIKNWKQAGQVFLDYILLREKLLQLEKGTLVVTAYNLEDLRCDVTALINMISNMKANSSKERLAHAEMGKTASNLLKIIICELAEQGVQVSDEETEIVDKKYSWSLCQVAPFIATLPLPPDYIQQELEEFVCNTERNLPMSP
ncbi:nuclear pore complex protein Nup98-Nup96-like [Rhopilema esculentum]|uniref:nuclear pore complex protein Nup98-Nup96-like n=1 Tax=Rhopilema esculentum TaxID=499914 RepID=UPI0031D6B3AC